MLLFFGALILGSFHVQAGELCDNYFPGDKIMMELLITQIQKY